MRAEPMSAGEFFPWLALTGVVLGPYLIYEAKSRIATMLGWAITLPSVFFIGYLIWALNPPSPTQTWKIPAGATTAMVLLDTPTPLPYTIRGLTTDWGAHVQVIATERQNE